MVDGIGCIRSMCYCITESSDWDNLSKHIEYTSLSKPEVDFEKF